MEWLRAIPADGGTYRLLNVPVYVRGISYGDIVRAQPTENGLMFDGVESHSGHSTYRLILADERDSPEFRRSWGALEALGCTYEVGDGKLLAIDVPPETDIYACYRQLELGNQSGVWDFEEGHVGHNLS